MSEWMMEKLRGLNEAIAFEIDQKNAEIMRLRADLDLERSRIVLQRGEIERLRAALTDVANQETTGPYKWQLVVVRLCEIARETLEGKP